MSQDNQQQAADLPENQVDAVDTHAADSRQVTAGDERKIGQVNDEMATGTTVAPHHDHHGDQAHHHHHHHHPHHHHQQQQQHQQPNLDAVADSEVKRPPVGGSGEAIIFRSTRSGSAKVRGSESVVPKDVLQHQMRRIGIASGRPGGEPEVGGGGGVGDGLLRTRHFKKAKSAATFMLDGVSYTIGEIAMVSRKIRRI